ncbi:hypothetical protein MMC22_010225, partial [Lobaria immixta]|nr:hypothetical protein [Lobaria immixta]
HKSDNPHFRKLLGPLVPDPFSEWEQLMSPYPSLGPSPPRSEAASAFQAKVKAAERENKETLWSREELDFQHAMSNTLFSWFEDIKLRDLILFFD